MKIAILSPFYPFRGGMAQFSTRLYTELLKTNEVRAYNFICLYPHFLFPGKTQFVTKDDSAIKIRNERVLSSINPFSYFTTAKKINKYKPDLLIVPYWMSFLAPIFGIIASLLNRSIKIVALVHNAVPHEKRFFDKIFAKFFFNKCDGFVVMSEPVKEDLLKLIADTNILLNPHPIYDHYKEKTGQKSARNTLGVSDNKKTLLFFGLIREYKGLDILIESMSYLDNSYQLIIAGESYDDFSKYQQLIDQSPLKNNIKVFEQYIPDDMVTTLFSAADVLVLPYRSATQSGVVALAYQLELPMVATNVGALGATISDSDTGVIVENVSPKGVAEGILEYFENTEKWEVYLSNIQSEKKKLSWASFVSSLQIFFETKILS